MLTRPGGFDGRSCGASIAECPVWGPVQAARERLAPLGIAGRYRLLDVILNDSIGHEAVVADSSKPLATLQAITPVLGDRLSAVHLVKDVRAYLDSTLARMETMDRDRLWSELIARQPVRARLMRALLPVVIYLRRWLRHTATAGYLGGSDLGWMRIGYDELCDDPDRWLDTMAILAGAGDTPGQNHILLGSFEYLDSTGPKTLQRDLRWQTSPRSKLLGLAHALVRRSNDRLAHAAESRARHEPEAPSARSITT